MSRAVVNSHATPVQRLRNPRWPARRPRCALLPAAADSQAATPDASCNHPQRVGMRPRAWPAYRRPARTGAAPAWLEPAPPRRGMERLHGDAPGRPGMARPPARPASRLRRSAKNRRRGKRGNRAQPSERRPSRCRCAKALPRRPRLRDARENRGPRGGDEVEVWERIRDRSDACGRRARCSCHAHRALEHRSARRQSPRQHGR